MKLTKEELKVIAPLFEEEPKDYYFGICLNYIYQQNYWELKRKDKIEVYLKHLLVRCCKELGIYSGDEILPIKHNAGKARAYRTYLLWSKKSVYGRNRWAVLNLMRKKLIEEQI